jgi:cholest-4-en-3-one 26-monooxygenase
MSDECPYQFDLMNPQKVGDEGLPFEAFKTLRAKCPVAHQDATKYSGDFWAITKREHVDFVSKNPAIFSSSANMAHPQPGGEDPESAAIMRQLIINMDPPGHV